MAELLPGDGGWAPLVEPASEPAETRAGDPGDLLRDIYLVLRSLRARPMRLTQQGEPHQSDLRRVVTEMRPHVDPKNWAEAADDIMIAVALATSASLLDLRRRRFRAESAADEFLAATGRPGRAPVRGLAEPRLERTGARADVWSLMATCRPLRRCAGR